MRKVKLININYVMSEQVEGEEGLQSRGHPVLRVGLRCLGWGEARTV